MTGLPNGFRREKEIKRKKKKKHFWAEKKIERQLRKPKNWTETYLNFGNTYCPVREKECRAGFHYVREHLWRNDALLPQANWSFRATYLPWKTFYEYELNTWWSQISHESQQLCAHSDEIKQILQKGLSSVPLLHIIHGLRVCLWSSVEIQVAL